MGPRVFRRNSVSGSVAAVLALTGCLASTALRDPLEADAPRVAFFGSSTIAGVGASAPERRWSTLVAERLGWREVNLGLAGSKLTSVPARIVAGEERIAQVIAAAPDVVVVMYGANDVAAGVPLGDEETPGTFRHAVSRVLGRLRAALPQAELVICSPQPAAMLVGIRKPYDDALAEAAVRVGATWVPAGDAFAVSRLADLGSDRIHLNDGGHRALAAFVSGRLSPVLAARVDDRRGRSPFPLGDAWRDSIP